MEVADKSSYLARLVSFPSPLPWGSIIEREISR